MTVRHDDKGDSKIVRRCLGLRRGRGLLRSVNPIDRRRASGWASFPPSGAKAVAAPPSDSPSQSGW